MRHGFPARGQGVVKSELQVRAVPGFRERIACVPKNRGRFQAAEMPLPCEGWDGEVYLQGLRGKGVQLIGESHMLTRRLFTLPVPASLLLAGLAGGAQTQTVYGTVALPADLADASAQVEGVLNKNPQNTAQYLAYCEGPAVDAQGNVFFTEHVDSHRIWKVVPQGQGSLFATGNASNGTEFDPQGRLVVGQSKALGVFDANGGRTSLSMNGNPDVKDINDLSIGSNGGIWFTNHSQGNAFYYRSPSGAVTAYANGASPMGVPVPNGIEWIEEKNQLLVCSSDDNKVYKYTVGENGALSNKSEFAAMPVPDGLTVDEKGNVYVASWSAGTVYVFDPVGKEIGTIAVKSANTSDNNQNGNTSNCIIGANKKLYITGDGGLYSVQLKVGPRLRPGSVGLRQGLQHVDPAGLRLSSGAFNPMTQSLTITLPLAGCRFQVRILDASLREVWGSDAENRIEWLGQNYSGGLVSIGRYLIIAQAVGQGETFGGHVVVAR
jgi:gluconolactonase